MHLLMFLIGLGLVIAGAELLVRGASRLAAAVGLSPQVIGLTVVAFGTSSPEMAVSVRAVLSGGGGADIALGNVLGSNIVNVLLILGLAAVVAPLIVAQQLVRVDVPIMIGVAALVPLLGWDGSIGRADGLLLLLGIVGYVAFAVRQGRRETAEVRAEYESAFGRPAHGGKAIAIDVVFIVAGLALLIVGADRFVAAAVAFAEALGVSELVIGLTVVSFGTSVPEIAASVMASLKGERDIAVGNVVGSNIFNVLAVLGLAAVSGPGGVAVDPAAMAFDIPVMLAVSIACLPIFFTGWEIARWEGFVFLGYYAAYVGYLVLAAKEHDMLPLFSGVMLFFVVPLTALTLAIAVWRSWRARRA